MFLPACVTVLWLPMHVSSDHALHEYYLVYKLELCSSFFRWQLLDVYFTNAKKTVLIVKPEHLSAAQTLFANTNIQITAGGQRHLGAALGSREFADEYTTSKIESWTKEVSALAEVATSKPHAAYCAFTHGMIGR